MTQRAGFKGRMKTVIAFLAFGVCALSLSAANGMAEESYLAMAAFKTELMAQSGGSLTWAEKVPGVMTRLDTGDKVMAITLSACGTPGDGYDKRLIDHLVKENIPATLFISGIWIDRNPEAFRELAGIPIFEIANHGLEHKPCSVNGKAACGVAGTSNPGEIASEVEKNSDKIEKITGYRPKYYRSGFAFYDPEGAKVVQGLGYQIVDGIFGDRVGTHSENEIKEKILSAEPGSIFMVHMNHPERKDAEAVIAAITELRSRGFGFVKLSDHKLK